MVFSREWVNIIKCAMLYLYTVVFRMCVCFPLVILYTYYMRHGYIWNSWVFRSRWLSLDSQSDIFAILLYILVCVICLFLVSELKQKQKHAQCFQLKLFVAYTTNIYDRCTIHIVIGMEENKHEEWTECTAVEHTDSNENKTRTLKQTYNILRSCQRIQGYGIIWSFLILGAFSYAWEICRDRWYCNPGCWFILARWVQSYLESTVSKERQEKTGPHHTIPCHTIQSGRRLLRERDRGRDKPKNPLIKSKTAKLFRCIARMYLMHVYFR